MSSRRTSASLSVHQVLFVAAIVIVASFGVGLARLAWTSYSLRALAADEAARVQALKTEISTLDRQIAAVRSDDYVRSWARDIAKQTLAGEAPIVLVVPNAPTTQSSTPTQPVSTPTDNAIPRWRDLLNRLLPQR